MGSDAKRTKLLDKGSFLQLILYGASYKRNYAVVIHNSKSTVCLSFLCMKDHQKFIKERVIQPNISTKTVTSASKKNFNQKKSHSFSIMCCHSSWFTYITTVTVQNNMLLSC